MDYVTGLLLANPLFKGIDREDIQAMLECLGAKKRQFKKGTVIFSMGQSLSELGVVVSGRVDAVYEDVFGGRSLISSMVGGQMFGDAFVCSTAQQAPVDIIAATDVETLLISVEAVLHTCAKSCGKHHKMIENLVHILADKYMELNQKMLHLSGRTIRRKLLSYLSYQAQRTGSDSFTIPFNQQELADYLFVERSGLSVELNKLKKEGIIDFDRNRFSLNREAFLEE